MWYNNETMNHDATPFFDAVRAYATEGIVPFHTPGHKQGRGAPGEWRAALEALALQMDVSDVVASAEYDDNWFLALAAAEAKLADVMGASAARFLANGTTSGVHSLLLASASAGDTVIVARTSHRSVIGGLILADAVPHYVESPFDPMRQMWLPPPPDAWGRALAAHPQAAALLVTYPSYEGIAPDLAAIVAHANAFDVPVLVDEAHGPHFGLHPRLPERALASGAEWSAQSPHKLLGAMTQASWLVGRPHRVPADAVDVALGVLQTTSPSALLLASLDVARRQLAQTGFAMMEQALAAADALREAVDRLPGLENVTFAPPFWDETKVLIDVTPLGISGFEAARRLRTHRIQVEMATARHVLALATFGDDGATVAAFIGGLEQLVRGHKQPGADRARSSTEAILGASSVLPPIPPLVLRPREAALGPSRFVPLADAAGEVASDIVSPYPPGIPVLCPGEQVSVEAVTYLQDILHRGGEVRGVRGDATRPFVRVVEG